MIDPHDLAALRDAAVTTQEALTALIERLDAVLLAEPAPATTSDEPTFDIPGESLHTKITSETIRAALARNFAAAASDHQSFVDLIAGSLHREIGGYPGGNHRMPLVCSVMRSVMQPGDLVLAAPPSGQGASLKIRYGVPRAA
jgi:5-methylcytosine-specific restriction protein A